MMKGGNLVFGPDMLSEISSQPKSQQSKFFKTMNNFYTFIL